MYREFITINIRNNWYVRVLLDTFISTLKQCISERIHNRVLTIVFWDISGFSNMCNVLKNEPHLIVEFLQEYFTMANKIINKHNRILDKFIGAGIMAYFSYKDSDDGIEGAFKSINAAFELQKSFEEIR